MVLLCNENQLNIKNYHMFKCIEKKKKDKLNISTLKENTIDINILNFNNSVLNNNTNDSNQNKYEKDNKS